MRQSWVHVLFVVAAVGCASRAGDDALGVAQTTITVVPQGVQCIQISVEGSRTVTRSFDVMAGQGSVEMLRGLPSGQTQFTGSAFDVSCATVNGSTVASWLSDPTPVFLAPGQVTSVSLLLRRNASASVSVDFQDDGGTSNPDLSAPPDGGSPVDLASIPDLTTVPDLTMISDLTSPNG